MGSLYTAGDINDESTHPHPDLITWNTFYQLEGPIYSENITIHIDDGLGEKIPIYIPSFWHVFGVSHTVPRETHQIQNLAL